ncbi:MAG: Uma2 family endonuclease [Planctomycetes bacterium]|nr:Uma2 family endonuclease [Planctomycetota bacterium]
MATLITDPSLEERLRAERKVSGADRFDESWEGIYMMAPMPNDEHQQIVMRLGSILQEVIGWPGSGEVRPGVNLSAAEEDWKSDYRVPDIAVFLNDTAAINRGTHWQGAADFLVEVISTDDRTREKLPYYASLGVRELLLIDRDPWAVELYRLGEGGLEPVGVSRLDDNLVLRSEQVPLSFRLVVSDDRPVVEVSLVGGEKQWQV